MTGFPEGRHALIEGWSAVQAAGPDAGKFLQSFCTNDVLKLADGEACEAMFTDVKARVLAYGWVTRQSETSYTVLLSSPRAEELREHLDRYLIREQVKLTTQTLGPQRLGVQAEGTPLTAFGEGVRLSAEPNACDEPLSNEAFQRFRIERRVPLDGVDVDERNLPQEVDRNAQAISFTKGCYLGQEPVARIDALGQVNWLLRAVRIEGPAPERDAELLADGKPVGRVTSAVNDGEGSLALAYVRRAHAAVGVELRVGDGCGRVLTGG